ncbi:MAG: MFS transporter [Candidatus Rokubacteria bacterium]|nr:MFS transporter [Candidatus Rokubacteria bacterium]
MSPAPFYGWAVVGAAFSVLFMAYGAQFSFGVFFSALLEEFGWSRGALSGAFALYAFGYSCLSVASGHLTDRWGPRTVIAIGGVFLGAGWIAMSATSAIWHPYVFYGVVAAVGMSTANVPCTATVARWFARQRGFATGLASAGGSFGAFCLPPIAQLLVSGVGWRRAYVIFGAAIFLALNLLAPLMKRDPEGLGLTPDGDRPAAGSSELLPRGSDYTMRQAMGTRAFWVLFALFAATWIPIFAPLVHLVPLARGLGVDPLVASTLVSALGMAAIVGRLVMGAASDRFGRRPAIGICLVLQVAAFLGFAAAGTLPGLYAASITFGYSYGAISSLFPAVVADFFGRERAGSLVGLLFAMSGSMAAWGPLGAGFIYDRTGSYGPAWVASAVLNLAALGLLVWARPPRRLELSLKEA